MDRKRQFRNANNKKIVKLNMKVWYAAAAHCTLKDGWMDFLCRCNFKVISSKLQKLITTCNKIVLFVNLMKLLAAACCVRTCKYCARRLHRLLVRSWASLIRDYHYHCNYIPRQLIANFGSFEYKHRALDKRPRITRISAV